MSYLLRLLAGVFVDAGLVWASEFGVLQISVLVGFGVGKIR